MGAGGGGGVGGGGGASHLPSLDYNIAPGEGTHLQSGGYNKPHAGGGGGSRDFYSPSPSSPSPHSSSSVSRSSLLQHPHPHPRSSPHNPHQHQHQYQDASPYSRAMAADSMLVHQDMDSHHQRALPSFPSLADSMEVDGGGVEEEPTPLHTAIARGQGLLVSSGPEGQALAMVVGEGGGGADLGDDTPSTSMEELSSSDSGSRGCYSGLPPNVTRQVSEECNAKQPFVAAANARHAAYDGGGEGREGAWRTGGGGGGGSAGGGGGQGNAFGGSAKAGGGGYGNNKDSQSSLQKLERLSQLPPCFKPDHKYTTMVAEQQMEEVNPGQRGSGGRVHIKRERDSSRSCQFSGAGGGGSSGTGRSRGAAGADTFPMRVKPQAGGATVEQVRCRQPGMLTKATSVPIDMKVEEFKKGG